MRIIGNILCCISNYIFMCFQRYINIHTFRIKFPLHKAACFKLIFRVIANFYYLHIEGSVLKIVATVIRKVAANYFNE
jgi:hypothetical protein